MERKNFKKYFKKRMMELKESKPFVASLTLISAVLVIAAGTYAFTSYTEWVKNHFQSNGSALDVRIVEEFEEKTLAPNVVVTKEVKIKNTSSHKGLIRVKLDESFLAFKIDTKDQTGNANIATTETKGASIDRKDPSTWTVGNTYDTKLTNDAGNALYYTAASSVIEEPVNYLTRNAQIKKLIDIEFNGVITAGDTEPAGDFWMYDSTSGYFYYSKALNGDEMTNTSLINKLTATGEIGNEYKGALYKLNVTAEGVYANQGGLTSWELQAGPVYNMLLTQIEN